jgi:hypothetical protein
MWSKEGPTNIGTDADITIIGLAGSFSSSFRSSQLEEPVEEVSLRSSSPVACHRNKGFALIVVLWTLVLIAFIVAHVTASGRTEVRIANNLAAHAVAMTAADGAIYEATFNLSDPRPDQRWPVDGTGAVNTGAVRAWDR